MKKAMVALGAMLSGFLMAMAQNGVVIESFTRPGQITFSKMTNSARYAVESSRQPNGVWTSVWSSVSSGPGTLSASVSLSMTSGFFRVSATVTNGGGGDVPPGMVLIPAGSFVMGATTNMGHESHPWERPQHTVYVSAFHMDAYEVTKSLWDAVTNNNGGNGYSYAGAGSGKATNHPVVDVNWFDMAKWCNARSQRDGLTPVYYADAQFATVYKTGEIEPYANWAADGYRLPTEAEWEKAARGGAANHRFPWSDSDEIQHSRANYYSTNSYAGDSFAYDTSATSGYHPTYATGGSPYTSPVGTFAPNGYGLYDMAGNVMEWCWDWGQEDYYANSPGSDPRGPASSAMGMRVNRGGSWSMFSVVLGVAFRNLGLPSDRGVDAGFRCAKGLGGAAPAEIAVLGTNLAEIASGDSSPSTADGTDFGSVNVTAGTATRTFFITNSGGAALTITGVTPSGTHAADFAVLSFPTSVGPGGRSNLVVRFDPSATGLRSATLTVSNSDSDEGSYSFAIQGTGAGDTPSGMVLIPAGSFVMGATTNMGHESFPWELPQHTVYVSAFHMDAYEVTKSLWDAVTNNNGGNGYSYAGAASGKAANHPVVDVNWFDMAKWCNARSQRDGLTPVYYADAQFATVYKTGEIEPYANWAADGYRLPTQAEWEKAARGGAANHRFPWSDSDEIQHSRANYYSTNSYAYDTSATSGYHPTYATGEYPYTSPVGSFAPNGYGLYDMAGNVVELCWDWYEQDYYANSPGSDPRGPASSATGQRVHRGGSWYHTEILRVAGQSVGAPSDRGVVMGFRCAKGLGGAAPAEIAVLGTNLAEIASGDSSPSTADGTDFGSVNVAAGTATRTFFITNSGGAALTITGVTPSGTHAADFAVLSFPASVGPGGRSNLVVRFDPSATGLRSATLTVSNSDSDEGSYGFAVQGTGSDAALSGMALIPAGSFMMGNATNVFPASEGFSDELPQHAVNVSAFYMDVYEVTKALWDEVKAYNGGNGYTYSNTGLGKATNHPVHTVNWYDVVKWCNARSQRDGLTPVYYSDAGFATVYQTGEIAPFANWDANGYRLPTEAEWEKAARGGAANTRFPWTDYTNKISWAKANYYGRSTSYSYDLDGGSGAYHPTFATGGTPYASPAGSFAPNGYGLYDMAGNAWEWCWDWYDESYYASSPGTDPRGPAGSLSYRVLRGGSWDEDGRYVRVALRDNGYPHGQYEFYGFRCARGASAATTPEIAVLGTSLAEIANGDNTPSTAEGTDFGSVNVTAGTATRTFFITNSGAAALTISGVTPGGSHAADFAVLSFPASVGPGGRSNLVVRFDPSATGLRSATLTASNSDSDEGSYSFAIQGTGSDAAPSGMALIPAGNFVMGNATNVLPSAEGSADELPQHTVYVSAFYMDQTEVTKALWDEVKAWADTHEYAFDYTGWGKAADHPVQTVSWFDCLKWCNARSEKEGMTPCYATNGVTFRTGVNNSVTCDWLANGYRLPTEAEWEKATRGGASGTRFAWTDFTNKISHARANYHAATNLYSYDISATQGTHPQFNDGINPISSPVGIFLANGYGLYDMAGNVSEWCWDWYSNSYYSISPDNNPTGPAGPLMYRLHRGGSWGYYAHNARNACRRFLSPDYGDYTVGFRCARGAAAGTTPEIAVLGTNLAEIASGDDTPSPADGTDFGSVNVPGGTATRTFFMTNSGSVALTISGVTTGGTHAADFSVLAFPASVNPGGVSNLVVRFGPSANTARSATITVLNNDSDEGSYTFAIQGLGALAF